MANATSNGVIEAVQRLLALIGGQFDTGAADRRPERVVDGGGPVLRLIEVTVGQRQLGAHAT